MANVRKTGDLKRQRPEMEQLSVLTLEVARIKESLKRSFAELRRNNIVFRSIDAKRRKQNDCEILNSSNDFRRNEKRKFVEMDEAIIKPNLINHKKIKLSPASDISIRIGYYQFMDFVADIKTNKFITKLKNYTHKLTTIIEENEEEDA